MAVSISTAETTPPVSAMKGIGNAHVPFFDDLFQDFEHLVHHELCQLRSRLMSAFFEVELERLRSEHMRASTNMSTEGSRTNTAQGFPLKHVDADARCEQSRDTMAKREAPNNTPMLTVLPGSPEHHITDTVQAKCHDTIISSEVLCIADGAGHSSEVHGTAVAEESRGELCIHAKRKRRTKRQQKKQTDANGEKSGREQVVQERCEDQQQYANAFLDSCATSSTKPSECGSQHREPLESHDCGDIDRRLLDATDCSIKGALRIVPFPMALHLAQQREPSPSARGLAKLADGVSFSAPIAPNVVFGLEPCVHDDVQYLPCLVPMEQWEVYHDSGAVPIAHVADSDVHDGVVDVPPDKLANLLSAVGGDDSPWSVVSPNLPKDPCGCAEFLCECISDVS